MRPRTWLLLSQLALSTPFEPIEGGVPLPGYWTASHRLRARGQTRFTGQGYKTGDPEDEHVFRHFFSANGSEPMLRNGTYVEMGALNGITWSNTLMLERELGWRGLLIEPSPFFADLKRTRGRPGSRNTVLNVAVCPLGGARDQGNVWTDPRATTAASKEAAKAARPACRPLSSMLRQARIWSIDFFSLDVGSHAPLPRRSPPAHVVVHGPRDLHRRGSCELASHPRSRAPSRR